MSLFTQLAAIVVAVTSATAWTNSSQLRPHYRGIYMCLPQIKLLRLLNAIFATKGM